MIKNRCSYLDRCIETDLGRDYFSQGAVLLRCLAGPRQSWQKDHHQEETKLHLYLAEREMSSNPVNQEMVHGIPEGDHPSGR